MEKIIFNNYHYSNNNKISWDLQSETLKALRFPLVVMVVFIHSFSLGDNYNQPNWGNLSGVDINTALQILLSNVICHIAVPSFYLISGYFFFYDVTKFDFQTYKGKLKKRLYTLIIPYFLWNSLYILWIVMLKVGAFFMKGKSLSNIILYFQENRGIRMLWDCNIWGNNRINWLGQFTPPNGPILIPLWFLRDLIVVVILTPIIYYLIKRFRHWAILLLCCCYITGIWPYIHGLSTTAIFFFSLGAYFSIHGKNMIYETYCHKNLLYILCIPLLLLTFFFDGYNTNIGQYIYPFYVIIGVLVAVNLATKLTMENKMGYSKRMSKMTFFVYAAHGAFGLNLADMLLRHLVPMYNTNWIAMIVFYILKPVLTIIICCIVYKIMKKNYPKMLGCLTGNRM